MLNLIQNDGKHKWLECGYRHFAAYGPDGLSINKISGEIGSSRASFYHYFGDTEVFIEELLALHWLVIKNFNEIGSKTCKNIFPDLYDFLAGFTTELQFNMQLFHHRENPTFNFLFLKSYYTTAKAFALNLFIDLYDLRQSKSDIYNLWLTVGETWYSRLDPNDLSSATMQRISREILDSVMSFVKSDLYSALLPR